MEEQTAGAPVDGPSAGRHAGVREPRAAWCRPFMAVVWLLAVTITPPLGTAGAGASLTSDQADGPVGREMLPVDVQVRVVNGTTREPGHADAISLLERGEPAQPIATSSDARGEVVFRRLYLDETRTYLVEATLAGITYHASATGRELAEGPVTVYVFNTTTDRSGVQVGELTMILRRGETELQLEYLITLQNALSPQQTILPDPASFELRFPEDATGIGCEVLSGLAVGHHEPVTTAGGDRLAWAIPLRSGPTRVRVSATLPYPGKAELSLAASAPVQSLALLTSPPDLELRGGFTDLGIELESGYHRYAGPALAAEQSLSWTVTGGSPPRIASAERTADAKTTSRDRSAPTGDGGRLLRLWVSGIVVLILVLGALLFVVRHRRSDGGAEQPR